MNSPELIEYIKERKYFWWWVPESALNDLSLNSIVEATLNYGNKNDIKELFKKIGLTKIADVFYKDINKKRVNYFPEVVNFFDIYFKRHAQRDTNT